MAAAADVVEAAGMNVDRCDDAPRPTCAARCSWQRYSRRPVSGLHRACGADIARGSLRLWSRAGDSLVTDQAGAVTAAETQTTQ